MNRLMASIATVGLVLAACGGTTSTSTVAPDRTTSTAAGTTLRPAVTARFGPGPVAAGPHRTADFAFPFVMDVPTGEWSSEGDTATVLHLILGPIPDLWEAFVYDFPGLVLVAFPERDEASLGRTLDGVSSIQFASSEPTQVDGRPAVVVEGTSSANPAIAELADADGTPFAGLGGYWFHDPEVENLRYRIYLVDMGAGSLLIWFSAPQDRFAGLVDLVIDAVAGIRFTQG